MINLGLLVLKKSQASKHCMKDNSVKLIVKSSNKMLEIMAREFITIM